jgi:hypothetical protein
VRDSACTAVGNGPSGSISVQQWDGRNWSGDIAGDLTATALGVRGVSCTATTACTIVGDFSSPQSASAARWNGNRWTAQASSYLYGAAETTLDGVSCASPVACMVVGTYLTPLPAQWQPLAELWDGKRWTIEPVPSANGLVTTLGRLSCSSSRLCIALAAENLVEVWDGTRWRIQQFPGAYRFALSDISCRTPRRCLATGNTSSAYILAERRQGSSWTIQPVPTAAGVGDSLDALSCPTATSCTAVGFHETGETWPSSCGVQDQGCGPVAIGVPLTERLERGRWTARPISGTPSASGLLNAVSCAGVSFCVAVGPAGLERFNGTAWIGDPAPSTLLNAVSCAVPNMCIAAGLSPGLLVDARNGTNWTQSRLPAPHSSPNLINVEDVSCSTPTACLAVGSRGTAWFYTGPLPKQTRTEIKAVLRKAITATITTASIRRMLRHSNLSLAVSVPTTGKLTVQWRYVGPAHAPLLIAIGRASLTRFGTTRVNIKLNATGRRLLWAAHLASQRLRLTVGASFMIPGGHPTRASRTLSLRP